jgi:hypothetical protein
LQIGSAEHPGLKGETWATVRGAPVWNCGTHDRLDGETCGIPHLAKNERDVGHPALVAGIEPTKAMIPEQTRPAIAAGIEPKRRFRARRWSCPETKQKSLS